MPEILAPDVSRFIEKDKTIRETQKPVPEKLSLPKLEDIPKELLSVAERVAEISGTWNPVEIYTATQESRDLEEKKISEAFDRGVEYNPQLTYSYANSLDLSKSRKELQSELAKLREYGSKNTEGKKQKGGKQTLDRTSRLFRTALYFKIKDDLATCDLVDGIKSKDEDKIAKALKQKYPGSDASLVNLAVEEFVRMTFEGEPDDNTTEGLLNKDQIAYLKGRQFNADEIKSSFEWTLNEYGLLYSDENPKGFKVKVDKEASGIDVRDKSKEGPTVYIPADRKMSGVVLLGIIAHEIEGHARQSINGEHLFKLGGGKLKIDNEQLYEGLGLRYELDLKRRLFGVKSAAPRPFYVFAERLAAKGDSFYKIYSDQVDKRLRIALKKELGTDLPPMKEINEKVLTKAKRDSWLTTYRIMRGHTDMSNKKAFANTKDLGYLRGYQMDQQLQRNELGFLNEEGVIASGALAMLAEFKLTAEQMPIPFRDAATKYCMEVLLPQMPKTA